MSFEGTNDEDNKEEGNWCRNKAHPDWVVTWLLVASSSLSLFHSLAAPFYWPAKLLKLPRTHTMCATAPRRSILLFLSVCVNLIEDETEIANLSSRKLQSKHREFLYLPASPLEGLIYIEGHTGEQRWWNVFLFSQSVSFANFEPVELEYFYIKKQETVFFVCTSSVLICYKNLCNDVN